MKLVFGDPSSKATFADQIKHDAAVKKALAAIRMLCAATGNERFVVSCNTCQVRPYETTEHPWHCNHVDLYSRDLRGYGLAVLNDAAKLFFGNPK